MRWSASYPELTPCSLQASIQDETPKPDGEVVEGTWLAQDSWRQVNAYGSPPRMVIT